MRVSEPDDEPWPDAARLEISRHRQNNIAETKIIVLNIAFLDT
jgi:hypothetical protein